MQSISKAAIIKFQAEVKHQGEVHYRDLPWRQPETNGEFDPYKILVSEIMLQQTQVPRVIPKYKAFLKRFPTVEDVASAPLGEVLKVWSGLGYNRRARFLWQAAGKIMVDYKGQIPHDTMNLESLPSVGVNTAGAILAYAFNEPVIFIETNIRSVFIHQFFKDEVNVADKAIIVLLARALKRQVPRTFYWALMDYGAILKSTHGNLSRSSASYTKQSQFHGSRRQIRGQIIRLLLSQIRSITELTELIGDTRLSAVINELEAEGLIFKVDDKYKVV